METLQPPDTHYLAAAEGWLGLKNPTEAERELAMISPAGREHPDVLWGYYHLHEVEKRWDLAVEVARKLCGRAPATPSVWIHLAYALHELKRTQEAYDVLVPHADKFSSEHVLAYNLACYCCQLGRLVEARTWIQKATALAGTDEIKRMAAGDSDLEPLRLEIASLPSAGDQVR